MKIDLHTHIFPDEIAEQVVQRLRGQSTEPIEPAGNGTRADLLTQMQAAGVDHAVVCPIATRAEQFETILDYARRLSGGFYGAETARRLIPFASVHPADPQRFRHLERVAAAEIRGVKIHPFYQSFQLGSADSLDFLRCCRDNNLIVQCHCGFDIGFPQELRCTPQDVLLLHEKLPELRFIAAHLGGWRQWSDVIRHLVGQPIYLDTSILEPDISTSEVIEILSRHPPQKLLFATDWPWQSYSRAEFMIEQAPLSRAAKDSILGLNAARLLRL